jgi:hypothetical protein
VERPLATAVQLVAMEVAYKQVWQLLQAKLFTLILEEQQLLPMQVGMEVDKEEQFHATVSVKALVAVAELTFALVDKI